MNKHSLIRTIYLYVFALTGLALLAIGSVMLVNLGLKAFIFTKADYEGISQPPLIWIGSKEMSQDDLITAIEKCQDKCDLTDAQKQDIESWLNDYKAWQEQEANRGWAVQSRHRDASRALSFMIIGLPLYLYHWSVIKKDTKKSA